MSEETQELGGRIYELAYHFVPTIAEESVATTLGALKAMLEENGAVFINVEPPKMIELAYEMSRTIDNKKTWFDNAYFGWIKLELEPEKLKAIEEKLERDETIIRYMIIKTVRENTIASRKVHREYRKRDVKAVDENGAPIEINKEEVDKQIDAMIAE
jgi:ribosomal protein S6